MANSPTDTIEILMEMGFDLDDISDEEGYLSALKEAVATIEFQTKGEGDDRSSLLREEILKLRRKRGKPTEAQKAKTDKLFNNKPKQRSAPIGTRLLSASKDTVEEKKEQDAKEEKAITVVIPQALDDVASGLDTIVQVLVRDLTLEKKQAAAEQRAVESAKRGAKEEELEKDTKKESKGILSKIKPPKMGFLERIKKFFTNIILGSFFTWITDEKNQEKLQWVANFVENHGAKIIQGLLALVALDVGAKILAFILKIRNFMKFLRGGGPKPKPPAATPKPTTPLKPTVPKPQPSVPKPVAPKPRPVSPLLGPNGKPLAQPGMTAYRGTTPARAPYIPKPGQGIVPKTAPPKAAPKGGGILGLALFGVELAANYAPIPESLGGDGRTLNQMFKDAFEKKEIMDRFKKFEKLETQEQRLAMLNGQVKYMEDLQKKIDGPLNKIDKVTAFGGETYLEKQLRLAYVLYTMGYNKYMEEQKKLEEENKQQSITDQEKINQFLKSRSGQLYKDIAPEHLQWNEQLGIPEIKQSESLRYYDKDGNKRATPLTDQQLQQSRMQKAGGPDAPVLPEAAEPANKAYLDNLRANPSAAARTAEELFRTPPAAPEVSFVPLSMRTPGPGQSSSAQSAQAQVPPLSPVDAMNTTTPTVAGILNAPVPV